MHVDAPPPYTPTSSATISRSRTGAGEIGTLADSMLRSSISGGIAPNSSSAGSEVPQTTRPTPRPSGVENAGNPSDTTTRERLRRMEAERDELRRAVEGERARASDMRRLAEEEHAIAERLKREMGGERTGADARERIQDLKRQVKTAESKVPARATEGIFKRACATDLLFLIDTTSSMTGHIAAAKDQVKSIMGDIKRTFLDEAEVRIAVVGYKDHGDRGARGHIDFKDFTTSSDEVHSFLAGLNALGGGGDPPEDVLGGIEKAINASWKNQTRCIVHIGDYPPHGRIFYEGYNYHDNYPVAGSEPHGLTYKPLLKQMIGLGINYALLSIGARTDQMAHLFMQEYSAASAECHLRPANKYYSNSSEKCGGANSWSTANGRLLFQEAEIGTTYSALRHLVVQSVTSSASRTAVRLSSSLSQTGGKADKLSPSTHLASIDENENTSNEPTLEAVPPKWDTMGWLNETLELQGFSPDVVHGVSTLNNMMDHDDNIRLSAIDLTIHKRSSPFAQGAMRTAAYARTAASDNKFVVKAFKRDGRQFAHLAEDMRIQTLCKGFALEFNALTSDEHSIDFIVTSCLEKKSQASGTEYMSLEPFIEGTYIKYNNNSGYVNQHNPDNEFSKAAQAFSHFTFERSCGHLLVCDLQGVGRVLTDPAIHTVDPERFKLTDTNLGKDGFKFFFSTHECNSICQDLGLKSSGAMLSSNSLEFRERWPSMDNTVCCSNKLCGKIVTTASANKSDEFPGCHWCKGCWPQLSKSRVRWICVATGPHHEFEVSRFYYESQGQPVPRECVEHREGESTATRMANVGGSFWNRLKSTTKQRSVSGKSW